MNFPAAHELAAVATDAPVPPQERPALVVFSPLRWHFDWQRPQQLLTRLAKHYRVFYVEEPVGTHEDAHLVASCPAPGVELLVPHTPLDAPACDDAQLALLRPLLARHARERGIVEPLAWLSTPMALPLAECLAPRGVIVDVMEDLAASPAAGAALPQREAELLRTADLVLAAGPSLYQSRRGRHPNVHCIPNGVDADHFSPAALPASTIEAVSARSLHAAMPAPRLGWSGIVDERLDLDLVAGVADLRPDWHLVMAGPVVGIDPASLPRRPNLHWIGPQTYAILPHLQAHWDVCILPMKCEAAARHASPAQALAYLAGQKPVVATPVHDVVALYGHVVRLARDADGFAEACRAAMNERGPVRRQRRIDALIAVHSCSWDRAAERVRQLLLEFARDPAPACGLPAGMLAGNDARAGLRYAMG